MCRLFGITAGTALVSATYWLLEAPDSMAVQSTRNVSGAGIGWFDGSGKPTVVKHPGPASTSPQLRDNAKTVSATTLLTHVRAATAGSESLANTHPFLVDGMLVAHNGGFSDLAAVDAHLGEDASRVKGQTDSERYAWLIARETRAHHGDVAAGIVAAAKWLSQNVPMYSLNVMVISEGHLWALRYPDERSLHLGRRVIPGRHDANGTPDASWAGSSTLANHQVAAASDTNVVVVASERIDGRSDWRMLMSGELVAVTPDLTITSSLELLRAPAHFSEIEVHDANEESF